MSEQTKTSKPIPTRIDLDVAIKRASNWRDLLLSLPIQNDQSSSTKISAKKIFRAINVNMADIDQMRIDHPDAGSFRIYMSIPDPKFPYHICAMLVPVDADNKDILTVKHPSSHNGEDTDKSSIYDFTQPCPNICDTTSPLFDDDNPIDLAV